jgi:hypothetical protein
VAATLACGSAGRQDVEGTVNAVNTAVELTLVALTQSAAGSPPAPSPTQTPIAIVSATPLPSDVGPQPPTQVATPPVTAPSDGLARPNGVVIHAAHRSTPPAIDGQIDDWPSPLPNSIDQNVYGPDAWLGLSDQSATFGVAWDTTHLYLLAVVSDDVHVQNAHGELLYRGDSLELQFDSNLAGDFSDTRLSGDDYQIGLSPGSDRQTPEIYLWNPPDRRGLDTGISLATRAGPGDGGYFLEAAIPWSLLGAAPAAGNSYGFALNSSDDDSTGTSEQQSMTSSVSTRRLLDPSSWGTLALDP